MGVDSPRDPWLSYWARWKFARLGIPLQQRARELGYCLVPHGSLARDIDLIAVAWTPEAVSAEALVEQLVDLTKSLNDGVAILDAADFHPTHKPHGRLAWSIHLDEHGTYLDLSIIPPRADPGVW